MFLLHVTTTFRDKKVRKERERREMGGGREQSTVGHETQPQTQGTRASVIFKPRPKHSKCPTSIKDSEPRCQHFLDGPIRTANRVKEQREMRSVILAFAVREDLSEEEAFAPCAQP